LVECPARSAKPCLCALGTAADRTGTCLWQCSELWLLGVRSPEPAAGTATRADGLHATAFRADEDRVRRDRWKLTGGQQSESPLALDARKLAMETGPTTILFVCAVFREPTVTALTSFALHRPVAPSPARSFETQQSARGIVSGVIHRHEPGRYSGGPS